MLENVYTTLLTILVSQWPVDSNGVPVVYKRPVGAWTYGDRDIKGAGDTFSITLQGQSAPSARPAFFGGYEVEHHVAIKLVARGAQNKDDERLMQEMSRIVYELLLPHRRLWIMTLCPLCLKRTISPIHLQEEHSTFLASYVAAVNADFSNLWSETHDLTVDPVPALPISSLYADALYRYWESIRGTQLGETVSPAEENVRNGIAACRRPIRLLYDVQIAELTPSEGKTGQEFLRDGQFVLSAKELYIAPAFGPDNVITSAKPLKSQIVTAA